MIEYVEPGTVEKRPIPPEPQQRFDAKESARRLAAL
jgi:hypothetical protein